MLDWNVKADSISYIILWMGGLVAVLIISTWFYQNFYPISREISIVQDALNNLKDSINVACQSVFYSSEINPKIETGTLIIFNQKVCINATKSKKCATLLCDTKLDIIIDLNKITSIKIIKNGTFLILED